MLPSLHATETSLVWRDASDATSWLGRVTRFGGDASGRERRLLFDPSRDERSSLRLDWSNLQSLRGHRSTGTESNCIIIHQMSQSCVDESIVDKLKALAPGGTASLGSMCFAFFEGFDSLNFSRWPYTAEILGLCTGLMTFKPTASPWIRLSSSHVD